MNNYLSLPATLFSAPITPELPIAFVMSPRLGDSLLSMVLVNNLVRHGFSVQVFGDYLYELRAWFPQANIQPLPTKDNLKILLSPYALVLHAYPTDVIGDLATWHSGVKILDRSPSYRLRIPMPDIQLAICRNELKLNGELVRENGLTVPEGWHYRRNPQRIVVHPTSDNPMKNWIPRRFLRLCRRLQRYGYQPEVIVSPKERPNWLWLEKEGISLPIFVSLSQVAGWIYESGWLIGNDSGLGHLASNLGIETVSLMIRAKVAERWRPTWAHGKAIFPPRWLITRPLKEKLWKYCITETKVWRVFQQLQQESRY